MARLYVGNLPIDVRTRDIEDLFYKYGRIRDIELKTPSRPPAFAFVCFENSHDGEDAIRGRDGVEFEGLRLRVEMSRGGADGFRGGGRGRDFDRRGPPRGGGGGRGPPRRDDLRRAEYRVIVSGLPPSCSWQDLKDFMRQAGDVIFTDVDSHGGGIVEFTTKSDQEYAVKKLDDTEFKNRFDKCYIRVKVAAGKGGSRSRSRSRSRGGDRSKSRSPRRSGGGGRRSRSRSRSASEKRPARSRSPRSRSRSPKRASPPARRGSRSPPARESPAPAAKVDPPAED